MTGKKAEMSDKEEIEGEEQREESKNWRNEGQMNGKKAEMRVIRRKKQKNGRKKIEKKEERKKETKDR